MIIPYLTQLLTKNIILASGSPRRKEILTGIGIPFKTLTSNFEEDLDVKDFSSPAEYAKETARQKALDVAKKFQIDCEDYPDLIIAADTVVVLEGTIIGKPKSPSDAISILLRLSGKSHSVFTGVALIVYNKKEGNGLSKFEIKEFYEETEVKVAPLTAEMITSYVETKEPLDKAGGYAIQGLGGTFIEGIKGDYYNIVGFPLHKFCKQINGLFLDNIF